MRRNEVVIVHEREELAARELHKLVALLADGSVAAGVDEGQPFNGMREKPQLRLEGFSEPMQLRQPLGNRWGED
jgi:hypothetical protein